MIKEIAKEDIIFDTRSMGVWCKLKYPNHPKGCPNFGKKITCPPFTKKIFDLIDPPFYIITEEFNLEHQKKRMSKQHPEWSEKQCKNLLYWQKGVMKKLREEANSFLLTKKNMMVLETPEANGVNVFKTCKKLGIEISKNPQKLVIKVMIIGKRKN